MGHRPPKAGVGRVVPPRAPENPRASVVRPSTRVVVACRMCGHHGEERHSPMIGGMCSCACHAPVESVCDRCGEVGHMVVTAGGETVSWDRPTCPACAGVGLTEFTEEVTVAAAVAATKKARLSSTEKAELWKTSPRAVETHVDGVVSFCGACSCDWGSDARGCDCECHAGVGVHRGWATVGQWIHPQWRTILWVLAAPFWLVGRYPLVAAAFFTALLFTVAMLDVIPARVYIVGQIVVVLAYSVANAVRKAGSWETTELKE